MKVQPHSVGRQCYRIRMEPQDPKTYLWAAIKRRLGVQDDVGVDAVFARLKGSGLSRGTVQRIKEGKTSIGTDNLLKVASSLGIEVWELCVPPGAVAELKPIEAPAASIPVAFSTIEKALSSVEPSELPNLLSSIGLLVTEPSNRNSRRSYVLDILSGELKDAKPRQKAVNE